MTGGSGQGGAGLGSVAAVAAGSRGRNAAPQVADTKRRTAPHHPHTPPLTSLAPLPNRSSEFAFVGANVWGLVEAVAGVPWAVPSADGRWEEYGRSTEERGLAYLDWLMDTARANDLAVLRLFAHGTEGSFRLQGPLPGRYDERALIALDNIVAGASRRGIRLILSLTDNWKWPEGKGEYAAWAGRADDPDAFFTDDAAKQLYRNHVRFLLGRRSTVTGVELGRDPAIFAFNLMNEMRSEGAWATGSRGDPTRARREVDAWVGEMSEFLTRSRDEGGAGARQLVLTGGEGFYDESSSHGLPGRGPLPLLGGGLDWSHGGVDDRRSLTGTWALRTGQSFLDNSSHASIGAASIHAWPDNWAAPGQRAETDFIPRWTRAHAADSASLLGKPLVLEEFGKIEGADSDAERARYRDPFFRAAFAEIERGILGNDGQLGTDDDSALRGALIWELDGHTGSHPGVYGVHPEHVAFRSITRDAAYNVSRAVEAARGRRVADCAQVWSKGGGGLPQTFSSLGTTHMMASSAALLPPPAPDAGRAAAFEADRAAPVAAAALCQAAQAGDGWMRWDPMSGRPPPPASLARLAEGGAEPIAADDACAAGRSSCFRVCCPDAGVDRARAQGLDDNVEL